MDLICGVEYEIKEPRACHSDTEQEGQWYSNKWLQGLEPDGIGQKSARFVLGSTIGELLRGVAPGRLQAVATVASVTWIHFSP